MTIEAIELNAFRERFKAFQYDFMLNSGQSDAPDPNGLITFPGRPGRFQQLLLDPLHQPEGDRADEGRTGDAGR